jgi:membrane dipeptidase
MKKRSALLSLLAFVTIIASSQPVNKLHFKSILVDTHNDVLSSAALDGKDISHRLSSRHSDLDRWKEGGVDVQFFSVWTGAKARTPEGFYQEAIHEINLLDTLVQKNPRIVILAKTYNEVKKSIHRKKIGGVDWC